MPASGGHRGPCELTHILSGEASVLPGARVSTITAPGGHIKAGSVLTHPVNQLLLYNIAGRSRKRLPGLVEVRVHR